MQSALLRALLVHGFLFACVWLRSSQPEVPAKFVEVSLNESQGAREKFKGPVKPGLQTTLEKPRYALGLTQSLTQNPSQPISAKNTPITDAYDFAAAVDMKRESELSLFFKGLWRKVDATIEYPADFVHRRVTGPVAVRLLVDRRGVFTGRFLGIDGEEPLLNAYVSALLVHAFREPLPERSWADREEIPIAVEVEFKVYGVGESPPERRMNTSKNFLYFKRWAYSDPKLNQIINRITTRFIPPIIPIPGGFYIDFVRAYEMVRNFGKPDEEEMRNVRLEGVKAKWDSVIVPLDRSSR